MYRTQKRIKIVPQNETILNYKFIGLKVKYNKT